MAHNSIVRYEHNPIEHYHAQSAQIKAFIQDESTCPFHSNVNNWEPQLVVPETHCNLHQPSHDFLDNTCESCGGLRYPHQYFPSNHHICDDPCVEDFIAIMSTDCSLRQSGSSEGTGVLYEGPVENLCQNAYGKIKFMPLFKKAMTFNSNPANAHHTKACLGQPTYDLFDSSSLNTCTDIDSLLNIHKVKQGRTFKGLKQFEECLEEILGNPHLKEKLKKTWGIKESHEDGKTNAPADNNGSLSFRTAPFNTHETEVVIIDPTPSVLKCGVTQLSTKVSSQTCSKLNGPQNHPTHDVSKSVKPKIKDQGGHNFTNTAQISDKKACCEKQRCIVDDKSTAEHPKIVVEDANKDDMKCLFIPQEEPYSSESEECEQDIEVCESIEIQEPSFSDSSKKYVIQTCHKPASLPNLYISYGSIEDKSTSHDDSLIIKDLNAQKRDNDKNVMEGININENSDLSCNKIKVSLSSISSTEVKDIIWTHEVPFNKRSFKVQDAEVEFKYIYLDEASVELIGTEVYEPVVKEIPLVTLNPKKVHKKNCPKFRRQRKSHVRSKHHRKTRNTDIITKVMGFLCGNISTSSRTNLHLKTERQYGPCKTYKLNTINDLIKKDSPKTVTPYIKSAASFTKTTPSAIPPTFTSGTNAPRSILRNGPRNAEYRELLQYEERTFFQTGPMSMKKEYGKNVSWKEVDDFYGECIWPALSPQDQNLIQVLTNLRNRK